MTSMERRFEEVFRELFDPDRSAPVGCPHVLDGTGIPNICLRHPPAGVLCPRCMSDHLDRADPDRGCDWCGRPLGPEGRFRIMEVGPRDVPVQSPKGDAVILEGALVCVALAGCGECAEAGEEP